MIFCVLDRKTRTMAYSVKVIWVIVFVAVVSVTSLPHRSRSRTTEEVRTSVFHKESAQIPWHALSESQLQSRLEDLMVTVETERLEKRKCSESVTLQVKSSKPRDRSLCPWSYFNDVDVNRIPESIRQAYCECSECYVARLVGYPTTQPGLRQVSACREVYEQRNVLRRSVPGNFTSPYVEDTIHVSVACVCQKNLVSE